MFEKGGEVVFSEQSSTSFSSMTGTGGHTYSSSTYYFKDVLVTAFDSIGTREWSTIIPKYQRTYAGDLGSISIFMYKNQLYVLYRDNVANRTSLLPERYIAGDLNTSALVCVKIDESGKMKKSIVMPAPANKNGLAIKPMWMELTDNEVILIGFPGLKL